MIRGLQIMIIDIMKIFFEVNKQGNNGGFCQSHGNIIKLILFL